ncbi:MAG: GAF domain-containing protein [Sphingomonadaceae bacterium]
MLRISPWRSLRIKIIAWSFIPTVIILLAAALVTFYAYQRVTEDLVLGRNQELTRLSASQLAADLMEYSNVLTGLARLTDMHDDDPDLQRLSLRRAANRLVVFDGGVVVINRYGRVIATEPARPEIMDANWSNRPYHWQMLHSDTPAFADVAEDGPGGSAVIVVAVPILGDQGEFRGTVAGMFRLGATSISAFYGGIVKQRIGENGTVYLVDGQGRVIYHSDNDLIGTDFSNLPIVQQLMAGKSGQSRGTDAEGHDIVSTYAPVPGTSWGLVTEERWGRLMSSSEGYRRFLMLLLALGVVVPALVVTVAVGRVTGPIAKLIDASQRVAGGDFGQTITVSTGDELEELARQFNLMSAQLQESYAGLEKKVADRTKELATLNAIAAVVSRSLDLEEILHDALDKTLQTVGVESGGIYLLDKASGELALAAYQGFDRRFADEIDRLKVGEGFSGRVVELGEPVVAEDMETDHWLTRRIAHDAGYRSLASVPVRSRGAVLGALFAATRDHREFTPQDVQLLGSIGHQIGVAVENAWLFAAEQRRAEQFQVISEVSRRITSILAIEELLREIVRLIRETLGYHLVQIGLVEGDEVVVKTGVGPCWEKPGFQVPRLQVGRDGIIGWVAQSGEPLLARDVSLEARYRYIPEAPETRSELAVPLKTLDTVIGVLDVQSDRLNAFDDSDVAVLQSLAHQAAVAIQNARLYEQAQRLAVVEERNRLARDLHDSVTQAVYGVTLYAEAAARLLSAGQVETAASHLSELRCTAQQALREMRSLIFELRPSVLEKEGLVSALQARLESVEGRTGLETELRVVGQVELSKVVEEGLYRICQEALNNVLKHSQARHVRLHLQRDEKVAVLEVEDDGVGFDPSIAADRGGLGLRGMEERAAQLGAKMTVRSSPGAGTTIRVEVCP